MNKTTYSCTLCTYSYITSSCNLHMTQDPQSRQMHNYLTVHEMSIIYRTFLINQFYFNYRQLLLTLSVLFATKPSGVTAGAGNVSQSTSSQESRDQSADQTLTRRSALTASHNCEPVSSASQPCTHS